MTGVLENLLRRFPHRQRCAPWLRERGRIVHGELVQERGRVCPGEPLGEMQARARSTDIRLLREIRRVHDERIAIPSAA